MTAFNWLPLDKDTYTNDEVHQIVLAILDAVSPDSVIVEKKHRERTDRGYYSMYEGWTGAYCLSRSFTVDK